MNKIATMLLAMLCVVGNHQARGDNNSVTGHYWFDNPSESTLFSPGHLDISANNLPDGLHSLNAYVESNGLLSSVSSRWFVKTSDLGNSPAKVQVMIDGKKWEETSVTPQNNVAALNLNTLGLREGLHELDAILTVDGNVSSIVSRWFIKTLHLKSGETYTSTIFLDGQPFQVQQLQASGDGIMSLNLDMNQITLGLHSLKVQIVSPTGVATDVKETMFMRMATTQQLSEMRGYYVIDNSVRGEISTTMNGNTFHFNLDASSLTAGLHSVSIYLAGPSGLTSSVETAWFIKTPIGGEGVKQYEYWLNDNYENVRTVTLDKVANPFSLINLVEVDKEPLRTTDYTFSIEDGIPIIYAHNNFQIRFIDPEGRITMESKPFTDVRVKQTVDNVDILNGNTTKTIPSIGENEIKWYQFDGEQGDSIALHLDRSAMYEIYDSDANLILSESGAGSISNNGDGIIKNGTYYLAVHDISGYNKSNTKVYFEHIPRFAVLSSTPVKAGAKGLVNMTVHGNGFDNLKSLTMTNGVNTISLDELLNVDSRYDISALLNIDELKLDEGQYDLIATFDDKGETVTVTKPNALELVTPAHADVTVEVVTPRIARTPYQIYIDVKNNSDQSCWGVPVNIAVADTEKGVGVEFLNFVPVDDKDDAVSTEMPDYFSTDNLLDNGENGIMAPVVVPYLGPHETVRLAVGLYSQPHDLVPVYAWCGQPWSDEFEELMADDFDPEQLKDYEETNLLTARELCYLELYGDEDDNGSESGSETDVAPKRLSSLSGITNVYYRAAAEAQRTFNILSTQKFRATNNIIMPMGHSFSYNQSFTNNSLSLFPTAYKIRIKVTKKHKGGGKRKVKVSYPMPRLNLVDCYQSGDPNDMTGYISPSGDTFIGLDVKSINYTIEFENDPEIANAPASVIKVDNEIDGEKLDLASFKPLTMKIGDKETDLPAEHHFVKTLDMRPSINAVAELTFDYDSVAGKATWSLRSLDPMTMEPSKYMDDGILPVNDETNRGTGYLTYSIDMLSSVGDGDKIANSATIIFDDNEPISTPVWVNTTDFTLPEASIVTKSTEDNITFEFTVEGNDSGSGIWMYDLYVRQVGSNDWKLLKANIPDDSFTYTADEPLTDAQFTVIATDRAGNRQNEAVLNGVAGDADGNGQVNATDVVLTRNYYTGLTSVINSTNADVTMDGAINAQDAIAIRNLYLDSSSKTKQSKRLIRRKK